MTTHELLHTRFGGLLRRGSHRADGQACVIEYHRARLGLPWSDDPTDARIWDLRRLNDAYTDDVARTRALLPLLDAYAGCMDWPRERQQAVITTIVLRTVREIVAELPGLTESVREQCRAARDLTEAHTASRAAFAVADVAADAADAANAAAAAAAYAAVADVAADAADAADARHTVLDHACRIWLEAATQAEVSHAPPASKKSRRFCLTSRNGTEWRAPARRRCNSQRDCARLSPRTSRWNFIENWWR